MCPSEAPPRPADAPTLILRSADGTETTLPLYSAATFRLLSELWLKAGWNARYPYTFSWSGLPIFQTGDDLVRLQELIWQTQPDVIVETGVGEGGGQAFYASLCAARGRGRVIGVEQDLQRSNRSRLTEHPLIARYCTLIAGNSSDPSVFSQVRALIQPAESVLVILDSRHTRAHVRAELELWSQLVPVHGWIVVCDTSFAVLHTTPNGRAQWATDHPLAAIADFLAAHPGFRQRQPAWPFNQSQLTADDTPSHLAGGWLQRVA
jgi:cephalosporin hydroxylase